MKKRNLAFVLLMSFFTLGIYMLYWLYAVRKETLPYMQNKDAIPRVLYLMLPWLLMFSLLLLFIPLSAAIPDDSSPAYGVIAALTGFTLIFGVLAGIVVAFWWFYRFFKAIEELTGGTEAMLMYVLWILLSLMFGPVWTMLTQNDLNKFIENGYRPIPKNAPDPNWQHPPQPPAGYAPYPQQPYPYPQNWQQQPPQGAPNPYPYPPQPQAPAYYYGPPPPNMPAPTVEQSPPSEHHPHHTARADHPAHHAHHPRQEHHPRHPDDHHPHHSS